MSLPECSYRTKPHPLDLEYCKLTKEPMQMCIGLLTRELCQEGWR